MQPIARGAGILALVTIAGCTSSSAHSTDAGEDVAEAATEGAASCPPADISKGTSATCPSGYLTCGAACRRTCTKSADCCGADAGMTCYGGYCLAPGAEPCPCSKSTDCFSGCCAPSLDANNHPAAPYVCKTNDGVAYDCVNASHPCMAGLCQLVDSRSDSTVCFEPCALPGSPPDAGCGSAFCVAVADGGTCSGGIANVCQP